MPDLPPPAARPRPIGMAIALVALASLMAPGLARAALPSAEEAADLAQAYGLTCEEFSVDGGSRAVCDSADVNDYGMARFGAQWQLDERGELLTFQLATATDGLAPPTGTFLEYLVAGSRLGCDDDPADIEAFILDNGAATPQDGGGVGESGEFAGDGCTLFLTTAASGATEDPDVNQLFLSVLAPFGSPTTAPAASGSPVVSASPPPGSEGADPSAAASGEPIATEAPAIIDPPPPAGISFANSVPAPQHVATDPAVVAQSAALAVLVVLLMPFPGQLFNSTLEANEGEIRRWLRLDRWQSVAGAVRFWRSWPGVAMFTAAASLLYGMLDPGFGLNASSLATFLGMLLGIVLVTVAFAAPAWIVLGRDAAPAVKVVPLSLLVGVACVVVSRITNFQPGYLYGLLIGLVFARELSRVEEARATAIGAGLMLGASLLAWIGLGALPAGDAGIDIVRTALAAVMVAGLEGVTFGLLPFRFLPGESLFATARIAWAVLLGIGAFAFFHVLINPSSGYLSDASRTPLFTTLALLFGFGVVSVAFWAWFRFRHAPDAGSSSV